MTKLLLALCLAGFAVSASAEVGGDCTWRDPGHDPYTGSTAKALVSFEHIPGHRRIAMLAQVKLGKPDDVVRIRRDGITGSSALAYDSGIYDMHFGKGRRCGNVSREGWTEDQAEVGDVYRAGRMCVIRPRVCGNWFWTICDGKKSGAVRSAVGARSVPEPGSIWLVLAAIGAMALIISRRKS